MRLSAMGDVAITVPVITALRKNYPELKITIVTRGFFKPLFRDIENVDFFIPDFHNRHKGSMGLWRLFVDLRRLDITYVADLHNVIRTKFLRRLFRLTGHKVAFIEKGVEEKKELTRKFQKNLTQLKPTINRYLDTITALGFKGLTLELPEKKNLPIPEEIAALAGKKRGKWIGVAPFAQHKGKIYPTNLTNELIGLLAAKYERVFIFGGGQYEKDFAAAMEARHPNTISVIGRIKLGQEMDLISNLECMVTMDSAAMHIASLVATPAVSVWGATHPYAGFYGFGQNPANAIQVDLACRPCSIYGNKPCLTGDYRCMQRITPTMIVDQVEAVVSSDMWQTGKLF